MYFLEYGDEPIRANPLNSWPAYSYLGLFTSGTPIAGISVEKGIKWEVRVEDRELIEFISILLKVIE